MIAPTSTLRRAKARHLELHTDPEKVITHTSFFTRRAKARYLELRTGHRHNGRMMILSANTIFLDLAQTDPMVELEERRVIGLLNHTIKALHLRACLLMLPSTNKEDAIDNLSSDLWCIPLLEFPVNKQPPHLLFSILCLDVQPVETMLIVSYLFMLP